ncbi:hypothetical protein C8Q77DRAFT_1158418 [Trametes polyzona]|nr:hypothetical protein C8Q77DRAFT_1158418 [Trametes polyzona]
MVFSGLRIFRLVAAGVTIILGMAEVALGAILLSQLSHDDWFGLTAYEVLGVAVGTLTVLTLPTMLWLDYTRTGAYASMVLVEILWLLALGVLWLAEGALIANYESSHRLYLSEVCHFGLSVVTRLCTYTRAMEAIAFLASSILLLYTLSLLVVAIGQHSRGTPIWTSSLKQQQQKVATAHSASYSSFAPHVSPGFQPLMQASGANSLPRPAQGHGNTNQLPQRWNRVHGTISTAPPQAQLSSGFSGTKTSAPAAQSVPRHPQV